MIDSFLILTILGAIIAIYSILPEHKKLRVGYSFGRLEKIVLVILAIIIITSSVFGSFISFHCENCYFTIIGFNLKILFILELLQLMSAIAILIVFLLKFFLKKVSVKNEKYFVEKMDEMLRGQRYASTLALLDENYEAILDYENKKILSESVRRKLLDYEFVNQIVKFRPYFGLRIITDKKLDLYFKREFAEQYFAVLLKNKNSILYKEIENNQNLSPSNFHRYSIPNSNRIIHSIFSDIDLAKELQVWKPIGEVIIAILDEQYRKDRDVYTEYQEKITGDSKELFNDSVFVGIRFFDIMIREALYQKVDWHMWLYYYSHFVESICKNYKINEYSQPEAEFPNTYSYMLYEIISNLRDWIKLIEKDPTNVQQDLEHVNCNHENGNIIKSSIICLAQCSQKILNTDTIPDKFKEYLTHIVFELYFDLALSTKETPQKYGEILVCCILDGIYNYGRKDRTYKQLLINHLDSLDKPPITFKESGPEKLKELKGRLNKS